MKNNCFRILFSCTLGNETIAYNGTAPGSGNVLQTAQTSTNLVTITILCGTFPFCDESANRLCYGTPVHSCELCSLANGSVLVSFFVLLALAIIIGNVMIIGVGWIRYQKKTMDKLDIAKTSLAIADTLIGKWTLMCCCARCFIFSKQCKAQVFVYIG